MGRRSRAELRKREAEAAREPGHFVPLPCVVLKSEAITKLSAAAVKLLIDLLSQLDGVGNNGDLCVAWGFMKHRGWKSRDTLFHAVRELEASDFVIRTRQGGRHQCSLYAVSFLAIGHCNGKLDVSATTTPGGGWKKGGTLLHPPQAIHHVLQRRKPARTDTRVVPRNRLNNTIGVIGQDGKSGIDTPIVSVNGHTLFELTRMACTF